MVLCFSNSVLMKSYHTRRGILSALICCGLRKLSAHDAKVIGTSRIIRRIPQVALPVTAAKEVDHKEYVDNAPADARKIEEKDTEDDTLPTKTDDSVSLSFSQFFWGKLNRKSHVKMAHPNLHSVPYR